MAGVRLAIAMEMAKKEAGTGMPVGEMSATPPVFRVTGRDKNSVGILVAEISTLSIYN